MKVSGLIGEELDAWVARALGMERISVREGRAYRAVDHPILLGAFEFHGVLPEYSKDWAQGGSIIDRERMNFATIGTGPVGENGKAPIVAIPEDGRKAMEGPTHLIAAMRAFVASKYGDTVRDEPV